MKPPAAATSQAVMPVKQNATSAAGRTGSAQANDIVRVGSFVRQWQGSSQSLSRGHPCRGPASNSLLQLEPINPARVS